MKLVLATANPDKAAEIAAVLGAGFDLVPRPDSVPDVDETGDTLLANARLKADALRDATGLPALADDTGLEVDALGGVPGVWSARFAGEDATYADNCAKLLHELGDDTDRAARFRTVLVVAWPDGSETVADGVVDGTITTEARGRNGFGYDPVFAPSEDAEGRTFAEMTPLEKHAVSHRGRAVRAMAELLRSRATTNP